MGPKGAQEEQLAKAIEHFREMQAKRNKKRKKRKR